MEYLMTYGWAILIVIIVGLILWRSGVFGGTPVAVISGFNKVRVLDHVSDSTGTSVIIGNFAGTSLANVNVSISGCAATPANTQIGTSGSAVFNCSTVTCANGSSYDLTITANFSMVTGSTSLTHTETGIVRGSC
jgi:hypothetical protein